VCQVRRDASAQKGRAMTQLRLPEAVAEGRITQTSVQLLVLALLGAGWRTAKHLSAFGYNDRELRAIASASEGRIVSGQKGYCLIEEATVDEANHAAAWLEHQAKAMAKRASEIRRAMHRRSAA
jgi:hypothetical protein